MPRSVDPTDRNTLHFALARPLAAAPRLAGRRMLLLVHDDEEHPLAGVVLACEAVVSGKTNEAGGTELDLPPRHQPGEKIKLSLVAGPKPKNRRARTPKEEWFLVNSQVNIPSEGGSVEVVLMRRSTSRQVAGVVQAGLTTDQLEAQHRRDLYDRAQQLRATNPAAAEPLMRQVLAIDEKSYGREHPNVARDLNQLAQMLQDRNHLAEAEPLMRRALAIDDKRFAPDHPDIATDLDSLAALLQAMNRLEEAEPLVRRHLVIFLNLSRRTGNRHPYLPAAKGTYVDLLVRMGKAQVEIEAQLEELYKGLK